MIELLKAKIIESRKTNLTCLNTYGAGKIATDLYKTLLGEIELEASRKNRDLKDEECLLIVKKFLKNGKEFIQQIKGTGRPMLGAQITEELILLEKLLPKTASKKEIEEVLTEHCSSVIIGKNKGQAMGIAMKTLKSIGLSVEGKDVEEVVNGMIN